MKAMLTVVLGFLLAGVAAGGEVYVTRDAQGNPVIAREDIYHGRMKEAFVPFTKKGGGTHYK